MANIMTYKQRKALRRKVVKLIKSGMSRKDIAEQVGIRKATVNNYWHYETVTLNKVSKRIRKISSPIIDGKNQLNYNREVAEVCKIYATQLDNKLIDSLISHLKHDFIPSSGNTLKSGEKKVFEILVVV